MLVLIAAPASAVQLTETWDDGTLRGWQRLGGGAVLSNPANYVRFAFPAQTALSPGECVARADANASGGMFVGDYIAQGVQGLSFSLRAPGRRPTLVQLYLYCGSGKEWFVNLPPPAGGGAWTRYDVSVSYGSGWTKGPGTSRQNFLADLRNVQWLGLYMARGGSVEAQPQELDDFSIRKALSLSGRIISESEQHGPVIVVASSGTNSWSGPAGITGPAGTYMILGVTPGGTYWIRAWQDTNVNSSNDFWEATGEWTNNPVGPLISGVTEADVVLRDPAAADGLPYWWLREHFGVTGPGGPLLAGVDSDVDGQNNWAEWRGGSDPNKASSLFAVEQIARSGSVVLQWRSVGQRTYRVLRSVDLTAGFSVLASGLAATPPMNVYEDKAATGPGPYFYQVEVEPAQK